MRLSIARKLALAGATAGVLLAVLTWTTLRASRAATDLVRATPQMAAVGEPDSTRLLTIHARDRADSLARNARIAVRLTWIAAILLAGLGFYFFRNDVHVRRDGLVESGMRQQHEDALRALSLVDDLTGLNNRRGFLTLAQQQIKLARRNKRELVLLFVDMDDFKQINDAHGHQEGDVALQRAARVLRATFRDSDIVARLGGDEFVVLAADTGSSASIIHRLRQELGDRNTRDGYPYNLSFSVGAARFDPEDPPTIEELLQTADAMLYEQKRHRRQAPVVAD
jgi:diguanylate cyclase (GGDEF)-like protein